MHRDRVQRTLRTAVWTVGALVGAALFTGVLLFGWDRDTIPGWAGLVAIVGTLLCGDLAERTLPGLRRGGLGAA